MLSTLNLQTAPQAAFALDTATAVHYAQTHHPTHAKLCTRKTPRDDSKHSVLHTKYMVYTAVEQSPPLCLSANIISKPQRCCGEVLSAFYERQGNVDLISNGHTGLLWCAQCTTTSRLNPANS